MIITNHLVYLRCIEGIKENSISVDELARFKIYCNTIIKNNMQATFKELCDSCSVILKLMIESPGAILPAMKQFIR
jgi:hypothetical protein